MAFLETFSLYLLHDLPWKPGEKEVRMKFERLWGHLRKGCLHFMRFVPGQHTWERVLQAQEELLAYGKLAEEVCVIDHHTPPSAALCLTASGSRPVTILRVSPARLLR